MWVVTLIGTAGNSLSSAIFDTISKWNWIENNHNIHNGTDDGDVGLLELVFGSKLIIFFKFWFDHPPNHWPLATKPPTLPPPKKKINQNENKQTDKIWTKTWHCVSCWANFSSIFFFSSLFCFVSIYIKQWTKYYWSSCLCDGLWW